MTPAALLALWGSSRKILTLVAVLIAAATVYVWWQNAERDRDSLIAAADGICEAAGEPFRPQGARKREWGVACLAEVRRLHEVEAATISGSLDAAITAMETRAGKEATDAELARLAAQRTDLRVQQMEAADAAVANDRAGASWACSVNGVGGLRAPGC